MGLSGRYDFKGIQKFGVAGISVALASTSWGAILITKWGLRHIVELLLEWGINWLANKGLIVLNIAAIVVEGEFDQRAFDSALRDALKTVELSNGNLTPAQIKAIDDECIKAARKFLVFTRDVPPQPERMLDVPSVRLRSDVPASRI